MKPEYLFLLLIVSALILFSLISISLNNRTNFKILDPFYFRGTQVAVEFTGAILSTLTIWNVSGQLGLTGIFFLQLVFVMYFSPYLFILKDGETLEVKTVVRTFYIPVKAVKKVSWFLSRGYISVNWTSFPFGRIPLGNYYITKDEQLENFTNKLQSCIDKTGLS